MRWIREAENGCGLLPGFARRLFRGKPMQEIQKITFKVGISWRFSLDINDPLTRHILRPGGYSGTPARCWMSGSPKIWDTSLKVQAPMLLGILSKK
jgi:hypothetical protein